MYTPLIAQDISRIDSTPLGAYSDPHDLDALRSALSDWRGAVCVAGGKYSMGGQTRYPGALQIDTHALNKVLWIDKASMTARVQSGVRWRALQDALDPLNLSVKVMQSYSNFTVGGSIGVNCHGRYVNEGAIADTVRALTLITVDGQRLELSRQSRPDLFAAVLGGYGGLGIVAEVELDLAANVRMKRQVDHVPLVDYPDWFSQHIKGNPNAILHNADLVPPRFDTPLAITWHQTQEDLTDTARLMPTNVRYSQHQNLIWAATEFPIGQKMREHYITNRALLEPKVIWRNLEASLDAASLEPRTRWMSTYLLQEYFIPVSGFLGFAKAMERIFHAHGPNILNVSIRHAPEDTTSTLRWAQSEVFCFVVYYKQRNFAGVDSAAAQWTRELVAAALDHSGRHYLPYRLHATRDQVQAGYGQYEDWLAAKAQVDPQARLRNMMLDTYFL